MSGDPFDTQLAQNEMSNAKAQSSNEIQSSNVKKVLDFEL
jgi:hypothetical protein